MKKLIDYINENIPEINLKIKTIHDLNEEMILSLGGLLKKYGLKKVNSMKRTILQSNPLDFYKYPNRQVTIIDVTLTYPVSPYVLQKEISNLWNVTEDSVIVRNEFEATEQEQINRNLDNELLIKFREMKGEISPGSLLSTDEKSYPEETKFDQKYLAGNIYNEMFKEKLNKNRKNPYEQFPLHYENDFNKHIKDAPKVHYYGKKEEYKKEIDDEDRIAKSRWGNFWSELIRTKPFIDKKGNRKMMMAKYTGKQ